MLNQCPNCYGALQFDIPTGKVVCSSCDSSFEPESLEDDTKAKEVNDMPEYETDLFVCPACGAEISSTTLDAVNYCLYCGSFVTLERHMSMVQRPEEIVPFTKTIDDCKRLYKRRLRDTIYGRGEFKKAEFLEGFKPIYIPYWSYDYKVGPTIKTEKVTREIKGDYEYGHRDYVCFKASGRFTGTGYDASSTFDDAIGNDIGLYDRDKAKPFHPAYMYGFYGDTADVRSGVYEKIASDKMSYYVYEKITSNHEVKKGKGDLPLNKVTDWTGFSVSESLTMLPVWFLTWRKGDRVAYSVMNGESGAMHTEIPISIIRYIVISLLTAIPIYFLLNANVTLLGGELLKVALALSTMTLALHMAELDRIVERNLHINDEGYLSVHKEAQEAKKRYKGSLIAELASGLVSLLTGSIKSAIITILVGTLALDMLLSVDEIAVIVPVFCSLIMPIIVFRHNGRCSKYLSGPPLWLDTIGAIIAALVSGFLIITDPAPDVLFYISGLGCIGGVALTAIMTMLRYNELITRPVPHFFSREKGGKV